MAADNSHNPVEKKEEYFEHLYSSEVDPWEYNKRAVEELRHEFVVKTAGTQKHEYKRILDVGCGKGRLTFRLNGLAPEVEGIDVSITAVQKAESLAQKLFPPGKASTPNSTRFHFSEMNITGTTFPANHFDLILLCDGLEGWHLNTEEKKQVLAEAYRLLEPGGFVIFTDYIKPALFSAHVDMIAESPLKVARTEFLNDRLSYQFNSWFKMIETMSFVQWIYSNKIIAKGLMAISSLFGKYGSKHFCVIAIKE